MRIGLPGLLDDPARALQLGGFAEQPAGQLRRRHQRRFAASTHRAPAPRARSRSVSSAASARAVSSTARWRRYAVLSIRPYLLLRSSAASAPAQSAATQRKSSTACPAQAERGRGLRGLLGVGARSERVIAALRLDEQAAQAEQLGVVALGHGAERELRGSTVAGQLRALRVEQQRQRLAGRDLLGLVGVARARRACRLPRPRPGRGRSRDSRARRGDG